MRIKLVPVILAVCIFLFDITTKAQNFYAKKHPAEGRINNDSLQMMFKQNINFMVAHLPKGGRAVVQNYFDNYGRDSCGLVTYKNEQLADSFEPSADIKAIKKGRVTDKVFVMPPFTYCDDGDSYCFYDQSLPRLHTNSYCCHPANLFVLDDIDEDGIKEIGIYYSSCTSRFKALQIYSLKKGRWKQIATSTFDTFMQDPDKTKFETLVKKISKGKFQVCDLDDGKTKWIHVTM